MRTSTFYFADYLCIDALDEFLEREYNVPHRQDAHYIYFRYFHKLQPKDDEYVIYRTPSATERKELKKRGFGHLHGIIESCERFYELANCVLSDAADLNYGTEPKGEECRWCDSVRDAIEAGIKDLAQRRDAELKEAGADSRKLVPA